MSAIWFGFTLVRGLTFFEEKLATNTLFWVATCRILTQGLAGIQAVKVPGIENVSFHPEATFYHAYFKSSELTSL